MYSQAFIAFIGVVIGAFCTAFFTYRYNRKHSKELEQKSINNLIKAFHVELSVLWDRYMEVTGKDIEKAENFGDFHPAGIIQSFQNYFIVYDKSSPLIGLLDPTIVKAVVEMYVNAKSYLDELMHYQRLCEKYYENIYIASSLSAGIKEIAINYLNYIKKRHFEIKDKYRSTKELLADYIGVNEINY